MILSKSIKHGIAQKVNRITNAISYLLQDTLGPYTIRLYPIGYLCNHRCPMCWRKNLVSKIKYKSFPLLEKGHLTIDEYKKLLSKLPPVTKNAEIVGGGEPLLYENIYELTALIKKQSLSGSLITNGVLLTKKLALHLNTINWDKIRVSVHASNKLIYKKINGSDTFEIVWKNIRYYLSIKNKKLNTKNTIGVLFVIQKDNYQDIFNFAKKAQHAGCDYVEFDSLYPYHKKMILSSAQGEIALEQLQKVKKLLTIDNNVEYTINIFNTQPKTILNKNKKNDDYYRNKSCMIPSESLIINQFGQIHPCCFLDFSERETIICGDLRKNEYDVWKFWKQNKYKQIRNNLKNGHFYKTCINYCYYILPQRSF